MASPVTDIKQRLEEIHGDLTEKSYYLLLNLLESFERVQGINSEVCRLISTLSLKFDIDPSNELFDLSDVSQQCIDMFYYIIVNKINLVSKNEFSSISHRSRR